MKIKNSLIKVLYFVDYFFSIFILFSLPAIKLFAFIGGKRLPKTRELLKSFDIYPIRNHYYQPLFKDKLLKKDLSLERKLPLIDLKINKQLKLLEEFKYSEELTNLNLNKLKKKNKFYFGNGSFEAGDAEILYQFIRYFKPKNFIEIGSGNSTLMAMEALNQNFKKDSIPSKHICIEPYEMKWLDQINTNIKVKRELVENIDLSFFECLSENDILFIDSSHIIRPQGDVLKEYLEIIPSLKPGVIVHVHDIFTPRDYLDSFIREHVLMWNEQYILEALLSNSYRYEILCSLNYLHNNHYSNLKKCSPYLSKNMTPGSFYFRVKR